MERKDLGSRFFWSPFNNNTATEPKWQPLDLYLPAHQKIRKVEILGNKVLVLDGR